MNEGGMAIEKQMEMFEDGGLMDEGGTIDPVSGNDVPPGSTQEEVRDDIPAQLSEGEFVFPADVVRYIGLGNLMRMRQEAKMGLRMMEEMGQMGNSEEATIPDDIPFDINDLDMEDEEEYNNELEMQVGGFVQPTQQQQRMGISAYQPAAVPTTGVAALPQQAASQQYVQPVQPMQAVVPTMQAYKPSEVPTFQQTLGNDAFGTYDELRQYRNETGNIINVPFRNGQPISPIPEGYTFVDPEEIATEEVTTTPTTPQTAQVTKEEGDRDTERQRREEEMYGPGGGRLAIDDKVFGVSFDGINPLTEGRGLVAGLAFGGKIPEKLVNDVTVNFKRGDLEFAVSGEDSNTLKDIIQTAEGGASGPAATQKLKELQRKAAKIEAEKRNAEELERMKELAKTEEMQELVEKARQTAAVKEAERKRQESLANAANKEQYQSSVFDKPEGDGPQVGGAGVSRDVREAIAEAGGYTGGGKYGGFAEGGLASKPKPEKNVKIATKNAMIEITMISMMELILRVS